MSVTFSEGTYAGFTVDEVARIDPGFVRYMWRRKSKLKPEIVEVLENLISPKIMLKGSVTQRVEIMKRFLPLNQIFSKFAFTTNATMVASMDIPKFVLELYSINPSLCGVFIDYFCRFIIQGKEFDDERMLSCLSTIFSPDGSLKNLQKTNVKTVLHTSLKVKQKKGINYIKLDKPPSNTCQIWKKNLPSFYNSLLKTPKLID